MPLRKANDVKQVEPGSRPDNTAPDTGRDRDNGTEAQAARDISALRREMERRGLPAGPPPTFEISQLEIEADIQEVIARVEAARAQAREAEALKLEARTEERLAEAEMTRLTEAEAQAALPPKPADTGTPRPEAEAPTASAAPRPALDRHV